METTIYHIVTAADFENQSNDGYYQPSDFSEVGFIHCTAGMETTLRVLDHYFTPLANAEEILVVEIDTNRLEAEVKFEAPAPVAGNEMQQTGNAILFPHIYGPLNLSAIARIGVAGFIKGHFTWPESFIELF